MKAVTLLDPGKLLTTMIYFFACYNNDGLHVQIYTDKAGLLLFTERARDLLSMSTKVVIGIWVEQEGHCDGHYFQCKRPDLYYSWNNVGQNAWGAMVLEFLCAVM